MLYAEYRNSSGYLHFWDSLIGCIKWMGVVLMDKMAIALASLSLGFAMDVLWVLCLGILVYQEVHSTVFNNAYLQVSVHKITGMTKLMRRRQEGKYKWLLYRKSTLMVCQEAC